MIRISALQHPMVSELSVLATQVFLDTFLPSNDAEPVHAYVAEHMSADAFSRTLSDPDFSTLGVFVSEHLVGYIQMVINREESFEGTPLELKRFYLHKDHHGRGIAYTMMEACYSRARELGYEKFWLGVWEHNDRAQRFYKKCGFRKVGAHTFNMGGELQTDDILLKDL